MDKIKENSYVSILMNSYAFFIHHAVIIVTGKCYRLLVLKNNNPLIDKTFNTLRGAKIAFSKYFKKNMRYQPARWTGFYQPVDPKWKLSPLFLKSKARKI
jgi:hypothetical protein